MGDRLDQDRNGSAGTGRNRPGPASYGSNQVPPLDFGSVEIGQLRPLGDSKVYGEALVSVSFDCSIEQLVNTLADMTAEEEIVVTEEDPHHAPAGRRQVAAGPADRCWSGAAGVGASAERTEHVLSRKLMALNLALLVLLLAAVWRLWGERDSARSRQVAVVGQALDPVEIAPTPPVEPPEPVLASEYIETAQRILFFRDRNPNVVIEAAPPKPLPPMPFAHGCWTSEAGPLSSFRRRATASSRPTCR